MTLVVRRAAPRGGPPDEAVLPPPASLASVKAAVATAFELGDEVGGGERRAGGCTRRAARDSHDARATRPHALPPPPFSPRSTSST
jgi:hypothetical protein